ncbi:DinB family protein [Falsibacillus pallidus]|uniref:Putative damage-inducible protein DinB n=1 Tax=Falsibacillus pallidus TaxID=493781 RepID=A0A370G486_9BACI|nr:DinB family protein [Falsibacillus pallidus]RDI38020.1 putative damage-inducible protein DinB [Falsibacillus pallidus]
MDHSVLKMYDYHLWANEVILNRLKELPQDIFHMEVKSGFSSVAKTMAHIYLTDLAWLEIISGKSMSDAMALTHQLNEQLETKNIEEMEAGFYDLSKRYKDFLSSQQDYEAVFEVDNPYAGLLETTVSETILHVVTHGSYHRGNIATMLRQIGHTSVMQDFGLFLYSK